MSLKNPIWLLTVVVMLTVLEFYNYIPLDIVIASFVIYAFILGLWIEFGEISSRESLKPKLASKIENIEKYLSYTLQKIDSEDRIKGRLNKDKKEIIEWLNKF